ncbi:MAG: hypothetical protein L6U16_09905 [Porphyromonadaceae bacterium]|nr:MAG: hypothetical protein L6U16_09905 [Porphyromonadaceae bacterium]
MKNIEKVSVYSLGDNTEFKTSAPFGEATVESGNIAVNGNLNLAEAPQLLCCGGTSEGRREEWRNHRYESCWRYRGWREQNRG